MDFRQLVPPTIITPEPALSTPPPLRPIGQPVAPTPLGQPSVAPQRSWRWLWWAVGGVIIVGVFGGGYYAYSRGYISIPFLTPKSDELFTKMVDSIGTINSAQYSVRAKFASQPRDNGRQPLFDGTALNANLFGGSGFLSALDPKEALKAIPGDVKVEGGLTLYVETDKLVQDANGLFKLDGTYTSSDTSLAIDIELRKVERNIYGIIRKFPSLFFFDLSAVKNKWVVATPEDSLADLSTGTFENQDLRKSVDALKSAAKRALDRKLFTVKQKLAPETIAGIRSERYLIAVAPEKLVAVYEAVRDERQAKGDSVGNLDTAIEMLKKPATEKLLKSMADNSRLEIWVDRTKGLLRQVRWGLTVVPDDTVERLKGKQLFLELTLTLDKVNDQVNVDQPSPTIDFDEATRLVVGITKEQQRFDKQTARVAKARSALSVFKNKNRRYPGTLEELNASLKSIYESCRRESSTNANGTSQANVNAAPINTNGTVNSSSGGATSFSIETVDGAIGLGGYNDALYRCVEEKQYRGGVNVTDVYNEKPFGFTLDGEDYKLTYAITLADAKNSYDQESYADGQNTATSKDSSLEKTSTYEEQSKKYEQSLNTNGNRNTNAAATNTNNATINYWSQLYPCLTGAPTQNGDADRDELSDYDEVYKYATKPCQADTDSDGYLDKTEIDGGYNPNGAGKATPEQLQLWSKASATTSAPKILSQTVTPSGGQVTVTWSTDVPADGIVNYGQIKNNTTFTMIHGLTFTVESGQTYHYVIRTCTPGLPSTTGCTTSPDYTFVAE